MSKEPEWVDLRSESGDFVDIVPKDSHHSLGNLSCWCRPTFEFVPSPEREKPVVLIKHHAPPHSFVSGDMKLEAIDDSDSIVGSIESLDEIKNDDSIMVCECCGTRDDLESATDFCVGPAYFTVQWIDSEGGDDSEEPKD